MAPPTNFVVTGPSSGYVQTVELSGNLNISFSRNRKDFTVNRWTRQRNCKKPNGLYRYFNPLDFNRVKSGGTNEFAWAPGTAAPTGQDRRMTHTLVQFNCKRKSYPCDLDTQTIDTADFDVQKTETENVAGLAMAVRAVEATTVAVDPANHISTHVNTATSLTTGFLSAATRTDPRIKKALNRQTLKIIRDSNSAIKPSDVAIVMNPNTAQLLSETEEVHTIFANSQFALNQLTGGVANQNAVYGLPPYLYEHPVIVEEETWNPFPRGSASEALTFVFPDNLILMVTVKGDEKNEGLNEASSNLTTVTGFVYEPDDMKVEAATDTYNRLLRMMVVDHFEYQVSAPTTGALITNLFS